MKKQLRFTAISNIITLLFSLFVFKPFFEELDDTVIAMIAEGAFGKRDAHLVYSNYLLGTIYKFMQSIMPRVRWHSVIQYFFLFIGFSIVTYVLVHYKKGEMLSVILLLAAGYETYVSLQFTKTAAFTAGCGLVVLLILIRDYLNGMKEFPDKLERTVITIVSVGLFIYGCLLRFEGAAIAVCVLGPLGLCSMIRFAISNRQEKKWIIYFKCFIPLLILLIVMPISDRLIYASNDGWSSFVDFNDARTEMVDRRYDAFDYTKNSDTLKAMGVSQNDAEMYLTYMFPDTEEIGADDIRNIIAAQPPKENGFKLLREWIKNMYDTYFAINALVISMVMLMGLLVIKCGKRLIPEYIIQMAALFTMLAYFQYSGRWSHRLSFALLLVEILAAIYFLIEEPQEVFPSNKADSGIIILITVVLTFCLIGQWLGNRFDYNSYMRARETVNYDILQDYVEENQNTLFCADMFTFQDIFEYKVFVPVQEGDCQNVITCGSWLFNSPIVNAQLSNYGYKSPVQALKSGNDNVRLIDNNCPEKKMLYLTEHDDGHNYSVEQDENIGGYNIYIVK